MNSKLQFVSTAQNTATEFLQRSIVKNRLVHAYLFEGEQGSGKKELAFLLAKSQLCPKNLSMKEIDQAKCNDNDCEECHVCSRIDHRIHPDVIYLEPEGLSIKKEQIQNLQEEFRKKSVESDRKIFILSEVEKLTNSSANSLLKYLEEPYEGTLIILLTNAISKVLPTIVSRCQVIPFKPLNVESISKALQDNGVPESKARLIANLKKNIDEGIELFQNEWFEMAQKVVEKLFDRLNNKEAALLLVQEEWMVTFKERDQHDLGLQLLLYLFKDLLYIKLGNPEKIINQALLSELEKKSIYFSEGQLAHNMNVILESRKKLSANTNQQLLLEQLIMEIRGG